MDPEKITLSEIQINGEITTICAASHDVAQKNSVSISNTVSDPSLTVYGERASIRKILSLILSACIENSLLNETVTVTSTRTPTTLDISFKMIPNPVFILMTKRLFEPIDNQLNIATIRSSSQSYIELLLARKLALNQRIKIWMQVENNTRCIIHCQFITSSVQPRQDRKNPLILVIEDNKHIRKLMELYLQQAGFETIGAANGDLGYNLAQEKLPDLITLDVMMPTKDGWQVLSALKENTQTQSIPVVVVSVMKDTQIGYELGAFDYLTKPVEHDELVESVRRLTTPIDMKKRVSSKKLNKIAVIDPQLQGIDAILSKLSAFEIAIYESDLTVIFDSLNASAPDVLLITLPEDISTILPLIYKLRLHKITDEIPFIAYTPSKIEEAACFYLEGIVDKIFTPDSLSKKAIESLPN